MGLHLRVFIIYTTILSVTASNRYYFNYPMRAFVTIVTCEVKHERAKNATIPLTSKLYYNTRMKRWKIRLSVRH